ncbi:MAG: RsmB/NOP family class I SAM-dependent RNA methyltransferase [Verrucomicrobiales bacterium]|nr:RsmB/NOP family class I SAM-dependent RNA methyltransferase [Verrucomicrobiales bacterium]
MRSRRPLPSTRRTPANDSEALAIRVLSMAGGDRPVDAVLREELNPSKGVPRDVARNVARWVFRHHRWRGLLDTSKSWMEQLAEARELARRFDTQSNSFTKEDWARVVPEWVWDHVEVTIPWLMSLQREPLVWIRTRPGTAGELIGEMGDLDAPCEIAPDALVYEGPEDLFRSPQFHEGRFEVQDLTSQLVTLVADPKPGESWWDGCAGEGGKTVHLADLMQNKGVVWATDRAEWRLKTLRARAGRAGLFNIRWGVWQGGDDRPKGVSFDGVLIDAPCSGVGTWQRNPHARWTTTPRDVEELAARQLSLLRAGAAGLKSGGRLVYAVCTLTRMETTEVAKAFTAAQPDFEPLPVPPIFHWGAGAGGPPNQVHFWPQDWQGNGMFVATWRKRKS